MAPNKDNNHVTLMRVNVVMTDWKSRMFDSVCSFLVFDGPALRSYFVSVPTDAIAGLERDFGS